MNRILSIICLLPFFMCAQQKPDTRSMPYTSNIPAQVTARLPILTSKLTSGANNAPMYTISQAGYYYLSDDIVPAPTKTPTCVIKIDASNVTLDLCGKSIHCSGNGTLTNGGILISDAKNVRLCNGQLYNMQVTTQDAPVISIANSTNVTIENIDIVGTNIYDSGISASDVSNLLIEKVRIRYFAGDGITLSGSNANNAISFKDVIVQTVGGKGLSIAPTSTAINGLSLNNIDVQNTGDNGIDIAQVNGLKLNAISVGNVTASCGITLDDVVGISANDVRIFTTTTSADVTGLALNNVSNGNFGNITVLNTTATGANRATGISLSTCHSLDFGKIQVKDTSSVTGTAKAISVDLSSTDLTFNAIAMSNTSAKIAYGLYADALAATSFNDVTANITTGTEAAYGFYLGASLSNAFARCSASATSATAQDANNTVVGFDFENSAKNTLVDCVSKDNTAAAKDAYSTNLFGFKVNNSNYLTFNNCQALNNTGSNATATSAVAGFAILDSSYATLNGCIGSGNCSTSQATSQADLFKQFAAGLYAKATAQQYSIAVRNCTFENNHTTVNETPGASYAGSFGIYFDAGKDSNYLKSCVIEGCKINNNVGGASDLQGVSFGTYENSANSTTLYRNNYAFGQGACSSEDTFRNQTANMNYFWKVTYAVGADPRLGVVKDIDTMHLNAITLENWQTLNISVYSL